MQVWTSGEVQIDVAESYRSARKDVERELNMSISSKDYGIGVSEWALIYILLPEDDPDYPEVRRYKKRASEVEFRLKVDYQAFKEADAVTQRKLLAAAVLRSIDLAGEFQIAAFDAARFRADVVEVLTKNKWA